MRYPAILLLLSLLAGCQDNATVREPGAGYVGLAGAQLRLLQPLRVAPGKARVFVQAGRDLGSSGGFDQYRTHCAFEIDDVDHEGVTIDPDTFQIVRVQHSLQRVVQAAPVLLAGPVAAFGFGWGGSSSYHEGYHFTLYSERQPDVMRMSCYGVYAQPYELAPPTLGEIRAALDGIAEIRR